MLRCLTTNTTTNTTLLRCYGAARRNAEQHGRWSRDTGLCDLGLMSPSILLLFALSSLIRCANTTQHEMKGVCFQKGGWIFAEGRRLLMSLLGNRVPAVTRPLQARCRSNFDGGGGRVAAAAAMAGQGERWNLPTFLKFTSAPGRQATVRQRARGGETRRPPHTGVYITGARVERGTVQHRQSPAT